MISNKKIFFYLLFILTIISNAQNSKFIEIDDKTIHYKIFENKSTNPVVLIINGGPGLDCKGFESVAKEIQKTNTAILYDQRGTGQSTLDSINSKTITMALMLQDMEAIRKDLKIKDWIVFGHSFGGMLASFYASKFPDNINGLILSSSGGIDVKSLSSIDINAKLNREEQDSLLYWTNKINTGDTSYHAKYQRGKFLGAAYVINKTYVKSIAHRLTHVNFTINQLVMQYLTLTNFDCSEGLKQFTKPVLIIHGKDDIIPVEIAKKAHQILSNSKLVLLQNCAHYGWLDQPKKYYRSIFNFLKQINVQP